MPVVKLAENRIQINRDQVGVEKVASLGSAITGNDVFEQRQALAQTAQRGLGQFSEIFEKQAAEESKKKVESNLVKFQNDFKEKLYSTEAEEIKNEETGEITKRTRGLLKREKGSAKDASKDFDKYSEELLVKHSEGLSEQERSRFMDSSANYLMNASESIYKHEQNEMQKDFEDNHQASISALVDRSIDYSSPLAVMEDLKLAHAKNDEFADLKGLSAESRAQMKRNTVDSFASASVLKKIETSADEARSYLETMKDQMNEASYAKLDSAIKGKEFENTKANLWDREFSHFKLSDGNHDLEKAQKVIEKMDGYTEEQKSDLFNHMKAKAGSEKAMRGQKRESIDREFTNNAFTGKEQGKGFEELMKMAHDYSEDPTDRVAKENVIRKMFEGNKVKTDPVEYQKLWEGIQLGTYKVEDVDRAMIGNRIDSSDWKSLRQMVFKSDRGASGKNPASDEIKLLADSSFGNSDSQKAKKAEFMYTIERKVRDEGLTKEQAIIEANNAIKSKGWFSSKYEYEKDFAKYSNSDLMTGELQNSIGADMYKFIGSTQKNASPESIVKFADQFGGVEKLRTGSPAHDAIMLLRENRKPVTKENVEMVLKIISKN